MPFPSSSLIAQIRSLYPDRDPVPLHAPCLSGDHGPWLQDALQQAMQDDGQSIKRSFEEHLADFTGAAWAIAASSGSRALVVALHCLGVQPGDLVLTQGLTYVSTANSILEAGAEPVFLDVAPDTLCLSDNSVLAFLREHCRPKKGGLVHRKSGKRVGACLPVHVLGRCGETARLREICDEAGMVLLEDAAQAFGSRRNGIHAGRTGHAGVLSFNWNKLFTCGGGGAIISDDLFLDNVCRNCFDLWREENTWFYIHTNRGLPGRPSPLHLAIGLRQWERVEAILAEKQAIHQAYAAWAKTQGLQLLTAPEGSEWNAWLNALVLDQEAERDALLEELQRAGIEARPLWDLMTDLPFLSTALRDDQSVARDAWRRTICLPSGLRGHGT